MNLKQAFASIIAVGTLVGTVGSCGIYGADANKLRHTHFKAAGVATSEGIYHRLTGSHTVRLSYDNHSSLSFNFHSKTIEGTEGEFQTFDQFSNPGIIENTNKVGCERANAVISAIGNETWLNEKDAKQHLNKAHSFLGHHCS